MSVGDYDLIQSLHVHADDGSVVEPEITIKPQFEDITETSHAYGPTTTRRTAERLKSKVEKDQYNDIAVLIRRRVRPDKAVIWVKLEIRSPFILRALTVVCGDSFFLNTKVVPMVIERPYLVLFHFRDELREYSKHSDRSVEEKSHLNILMGFMAREFGRLELDYSQHIPKGQVEFSTVWTLFKLNEEVFLNHDNYITCGVVCDVRFLDGRQPAWSIGTRSWAYNGTHFGPVDTHFKIDQFDGIYDITSLPLYPVRYHRSRDKIDLRERLIERGRKWKRMVDVTHCNYDSVAWTSPDQKHDCDKDNLVRIHVSGRIILDYNTHRQANMNQQTRFSRAALTQRDRYDEDTDSDTSSIGSSRSRHKSPVIDESYASRFGVRLKEASYEMTDNQALLCPARIRGFSLADKKWAFFLVDDVTGIVWRENAMEGLEIDAESKSIIGALVTAHERRQHSTTAQFQDIIPGKGMGLTFLFAGAPGLGKTLTAELISENEKKALYSITSGELGTDTVEADNRLRMIFNRAKAWDAYLLLDEADVFLAARNQDDLARNGLVTVFLRLIEYYEGVIFLTTNRLTTFDTAFESRIQFKLFYDPLTPEQRAKIWKTLLPPRIVPHSNPVKKLAWDEEVLLKLGRDYDINGREIKNMIKTAHALAESAEQTLGEEHLSKVKLINDKWHAKAEENSKQTVSEQKHQCTCIGRSPGEI